MLLTHPVYKHCRVFYRKSQLVAVYLHYLWMWPFDSVSEQILIGMSPSHFLFDFDYYVYIELS